KRRSGTAPRYASPHGERSTLARSAAPAASHAGVILAYPLPVSTLAWRPHWALARRGTPRPNRQFRERSGRLANPTRRGAFEARWLAFTGWTGMAATRRQRSEERRVGKECRSRWSPDH